MKKLLFTDSAGNKLWAKQIKTRNVTQFFGTNRQNRIINKPGVNTLVGRARRGGIKGLPGTGICVKRVRRRQGGLVRTFRMRK